MEQSHGQKSSKSFRVSVSYISEVEGDFKVVPEVVGELGIHVQHFQDIFSEDFMEVTVGQSPHISVGFARSGIKVDWLAEDVVLPWGLREGGRALK